MKVSMRDRLHAAEKQIEKLTKQLESEKRDAEMYKNSHERECKIVHMPESSIGCTCGLDATLKQFHRLMRR